MTQCLMGSVESENDWHTKTPAGSPVAVFHAYGARLSLRNANNVSQGLWSPATGWCSNQGEIRATSG